MELLDQQRKSKILFSQPMELDNCSVKCVSNRYNILSDSETQCFKACLSKSRYPFLLAAKWFFILILLFLIFSSSSIPYYLFLSGIKDVSMTHWPINKKILQN